MNDIPRLSAKEMEILQLLIARGEAYGLEMVKASEGRLKRGTIYVTLNRREEKGYVESRKAPVQAGQQGPPRRLYKATGHGARVLDAWQMYLNWAQGGLALGGVG